MGSLTVEVLLKSLGYMHMQFQAVVTGEIRRPSYKALTYSIYSVYAYSENSLAFPFEGPVEPFLAFPFLLFSIRPAFSFQKNV